MRFSSNKSRRLVFEPLNNRIVLSADGISGDPCITQDGSQLMIEGGDGDDAILLSLSDGSSDYEVQLNGETTTYAAGDITEIVIDGKAGVDTVSIVGSDLDETTEFNNGVLSHAANNNEYDVQVSNAEHLTADAGLGMNRGTLNDTAEDDQVQMFDGSASLVNSAGTDVVLSGYSRVIALAQNGGQDDVEFIGSDASEIFVARSDFSFMFSSGMLHFARGFDNVDAVSNDGADRAWLFDSAGDDQLANAAVSRVTDLSRFGETDQADAVKDQVLLSRSDSRSFATYNFGETYVIASSGNDTASLVGHTDVADRFEWSEDEASLSTTGTAVSRTYVARGFDRVVATGGESNDRASLNGSESDDTLIALPEAVQLTTPLSEGLALDFGLVASRGGGGVDFAHLEDSRFNDTFIGQRNFAYMRGTGYTNVVTSFEKIDAVAFNGGFDRATSSQYVGNIDFLVWDGPQYWILGQTRNERVFGMEDNRGISEDVVGDLVPTTDADGNPIQHDINGAGWQVTRALVVPFTLSRNHDMIPKLTSEHLDEISSRNETPAGDYDLVDGRLVRVGDATEPPPLETDS